MLTRFREKYLYAFGGGSASFYVFKDDHGQFFNLAGYFAGFRCLNSTFRMENRPHFNLNIGGRIRTVVFYTQIHKQRDTSCPGIVGWYQFRDCQVVVPGFHTIHQMDFFTFGT